jgi:hypothetical protein
MAISLSSAISGKKEPKRNNRWILKFDTIPTISGQALSGQSSNGGQDAAESLAIDLLSASRPTLNFNSATVSRLNEKWKFASNPTWSTISVAFYDFDLGQHSATQILWRWCQTIYDVLNGTMGYAAMYKVDASLILLGPGQSVVSGHTGASTNIDIIEAWDLFGCYPDSLTTGTLSYDSADVLQTSVELNFDYANLHTAADMGNKLWING